MCIFKYIFNIAISWHTHWSIILRIYHHIYNFGTVGIFLAMGRKKKTYIYEDDNIVQEKAGYPVYLIAFLSVVALMTFLTYLVETSIYKAVIKRSNA